jgi:Dihydroorotate dehydrogenase
MDLESLYLDILRTVKESVKIPVALKLSPFFSALPNIASQFEDAGVRQIAAALQTARPASTARAVSQSSGKPTHAVGFALDQGIAGEKAVGIRRLRW